jgi:hypothetical protein
MTNPFDRPMAYPWKRDEAQVLFNMLIRDIGNKVEIKRLFQTAGGQAADLNEDQTIRRVWIQALDLLAPMGAILTLCRQLLDDHGDLPDVCAAAQAMLDALPAVERRIAPGGRITVDREPLRRSLSDLSLEEPPFKVILVRGDPKSGKTWSRYLFERAAKDLGADVTFIDRNTVGRVEDVVKKLFAILGVEEKRIPAQDSPGPHWYRDVCNELAAVALNRKPPRQLWIAVDDLGFQPDGKTPLMDDAIRHFFNQFVMHMLDPATYPWFRLMLIHYPDTEPSGWEREVWEEDRPLARDVCKDDVVEVFREWWRDRGKETLDDELDRLASGVIAYADAPQPGNTKPRLQLVREELNRQLDSWARL